MGKSAGAEQASSPRAEGGTRDWTLCSCPYEKSSTATLSGTAITSRHVTNSSEDLLYYLMVRGFYLFLANDLKLVRYGLGKDNERRYSEVTRPPLLMQNVLRVSASDTAT
jgi:hypothetical protein